jgi:predicted MFS family arabinose efflux permease
MVLLGIGEIVGGQLVGTIKDKVGVKVATVFQILLLISGTALILAFNNDEEFGPLAYGMCFVWGL